MKRFWTWALLLTALALGVRFWVAFAVTSDCSGDGPIYWRLGQNLVEHGVYSAASAPPFAPSLIRMPGLPLVVAAVVALFSGHAHDALLTLQVLADTLTCGLAAVLCLLWLPASWGRWRRDVAALAAFALLALCPYTLVYTGMVLTETWALLFGTLCVLLGTWALKGPGPGLLGWAASGASGAVACMFRPDMGLYLAALGALLLARWVSGIRDDRSADEGWRAAVPSTRRTLFKGLAFSLAFVVVLTPWAVRNALRFHLFQPLAPAAANMPDEYVARGYADWVRTWITRPRDVEFFVWPVEEKVIDPAGLPPGACDSADERRRVAELFSWYNRGVDPGAPPDAVSENTAVLSRAIDAEFARLARERIAAHPIRYYVWLPVRRAWNLWFDTHSIYYPFDGYLPPLREMRLETREDWLLPAFYLLVWVYTALGIGGAWVLWRAPGCREWVVLAGLLFLPRLAFLSTMPNPEPRYMIELFPVVAALGGAFVASRLREPPAAGEGP